MNPSQVRKRIMQEHAALRRRLRELEAAVDAMHGNRSLAASVAAVARGLVEDVVAHTQLEDALLAPVLRDIDAWGSVRAELLLDHHSEQRAQLRELLECYERDDDCAQLARITLDWVREMKTDMAHEEADVLSAALLRDDPIAIGMESG